MQIDLVNPRQPYDHTELEPIELAQLARCGELWDGEDLPAERRLYDSDEVEEGNFFGEFLAIWDVLVDGEHEYDLWVYMVDSGTVFRRGTTDVVLSRIQFDFAAGGGDPELAEAIEAAYEEAAAELEED